MDYGTLVNTVQARAGLQSPAEATRFIDATLSALAERLTPQEAEQLGAQLPQEVTAVLRDLSGEAGEKFGLGEFYRRVRTRAASDPAEARRVAPVVMSVVCEAASSGEIENLKSQLLPEFQELFESRGAGPIGGYAQNSGQPNQQA